MSKASDAERQSAIEQLREWIKPGDTVYTILRSVSRSGMSREIGVVLLLPEGRGNELEGITPVDVHPNYAVSKALGARMGKRDGVVVDGCGMDMGFQLVYLLGATLWPAGFGCIGEGCRSNDHSNGDRDRTPHHETKPHWHRNGGYALNHRWL